MSVDALISADGQVAVFSAQYGNYIKDDANQERSSLYVHRLESTPSRSAAVTARDKSPSTLAGGPTGSRVRLVIATNSGDLKEVP